MLKNMKIGVKLILVGTLIIVVSLIAVTTVAVTRASSGLEELNNQQLVSRAQEIAQNIEDIFAEEMKLAIVLANNPAVVAAARARAGEGVVAEAAKTGPTTSKTKAVSPAPDTVAIATEHLTPFKNVKDIASAYESANIIGSDGTVFVSTEPRAIGLNSSSMTALENQLVKSALEGKLSIGKAEVSPITGKPIIHLAVPVTSEGKAVGVLLLVLRIDFLNNIVGREKVGRTGYAAVLDGAGVVIAHPNSDLIMKMNVLRPRG